MSGTAIRAALTAIAPGPTTLAGLTLALRPEGGRLRTWRSVATTTLTVMLFGAVVASVVSAVVLIGTPARYGFDADLLALNQYGDQSPGDLTAAFARDRDVVAATGYTAANLLARRPRVPGLAATPVKGDLAPTILRGDAPRAAGEIVLGQQTFQMSGRTSERSCRSGSRQPTSPARAARDAADDAVEMRVVGVATFPPVNQAGTTWRGSVSGRSSRATASSELNGVPTNQPEFTVVRLADGVDPATVIARNPAGFTDPTRTSTAWFTDTEPAELRQLEAAMPYLRGAGRVRIPGAVRSGRARLVDEGARDAARAGRAPRVGLTRRQLDAVTTWQVAPFAVATVLVGLPIGILVGQRAFTVFADSLAVVDTATVPAATYGALVLTVVVGFVVATLVSVAVSRRLRVATLLRED